jgi:hypothetical protein
LSRYAWKNFSFEPPPGMVDETVLTFVEDPDRGSRNVTLLCDQLSPGAHALETYVASQQRELSAALEGYTARSSEKRVVGDLPAVVVEHTAAAPEGGRLYQFQAYVREGDQVLVVTGTGTDREEAAVRAGVEHVLKTLQAKKGRG